MSSGISGTENNFGEIVPSSISGSVFIDTNDDGIRQTDEPGVQGVTITLSGVNDLGQTVRLVTVSNSSGSFEFGQLRPGQYTLTESPLADYTDGKDAAGTAGGNVGTDVISTVNLKPGVAAADYTFSELGTSVSGRVFTDNNGTGTFEPGDIPIPGAEVTIYNNSGQVVGTTTTNSDGEYLFPGFPLGSYTFSVATTNPDGTQTSTTRALSVGSGEPVTLSIALSGNSGAISGTVFNDVNDDGQRQESESGVAGVVIDLTGTDASGNAVSRSVNSSQAGTYTFSQLLAGSYTVVAIEPSGDLVDKASPSTRSEVLAAGGSATANFGLLPPSTLSGKVYLETKGAGINNALGIAHVPVSLTGVDDRGNTVSLTTSTDADGNYQFGDLRPGEYTILRGASPLFSNGPDTVGSLGGKAQGLSIEQISLMGGESGLNYDFAQRVKKSCVLATPAYQSVLSLVTKPEASVDKASSRQPLIRHVSARISHWIPQLATKLRALAFRRK